ncbi:MAG: acyl-CoA carboxylase subunit beta [Treponemataceae bacterium]
MSLAQEKLQELKQKKEQIFEAGGKVRIEKQHAGGKMTARERMLYFFDEGTFVEIDAFVQHRCSNFGMKELPSESVITGYGKVNGRLVYAFSQDFTILGGSLGEYHAQKICKAMDMAAKVGCPILGICDSGGARIQEGLDSLNGYGEIFFRNTRNSGVIPQISAIMGPSAGGAVYSPALTDFIFMVDKTSQMFITGPQVIKAVTGEQISAEELGGAEAHNSKSGCANFFTANDKDCLDKIKKLLSFLPQNNMEVTPLADCKENPNQLIEDFNTIIPDSANKPYDMFDIIKKLADNGDYMEYSECFAKNVITCFARINGRSVGIVANQPTVMAGCLDMHSSDKIGRFVRFCDAFNIPLLTIVDVPGFLPGVAQEHGGIIRHGAKALYAYSEATVPKVTLITRKAYGGAYLAMSCKATGGDMVLAWPTAEIAVMGADGAINIIFKRDIDAASDKNAKRAEMIDVYSKEFANPYQAAKRGFVDAVIEPATSRQRIIDAFDMLEGKKDKLPAKKHGNLPV